MKLNQALILFLFLLMGSIQLTYAHGDLHERIIKVSAEIKITPDSSYLYFKRGKLYFQHKDFEEAIQDMFTANDLGFHDIQCDLIFAKANKELLDYEEALFYLDKIDKETPNHVIALKTRADIYYQQQNYKSAAAIYEKVIEVAIKTTPENYLAAHNSWVQCQTLEGDKKATEILNVGIETLGPIFTLLDKQQKFYVAKSDYINALLIQEKIIESSNRKEVAYYNAAKLCRYADNEAMKKKYLERSLDAIDQLSPRKQQVKAMKQLRQSVEAELKLISNRENPNGDCSH